uniref:Uncharacterized protein n=1 Tax=Rhizophora mucronata TaxID=61149 RepID=A0A2P2INW3_RHIMU
MTRMILHLYHAMEISCDPFMQFGWGRGSNVVFNTQI